jgi:hypothetical protein
VAQRLAILSPVLVLIVALGSPGCGAQDSRLPQHEEKFESLGSTTRAIAEAWLAGNVSRTYALTALEKTYLLVEQERSALASAPQVLLNPGGARLSQAAERLSRLLAVMMHDVGAADRTSVRRHLVEIPIEAPEQK